MKKAPDDIELVKGDPSRAAGTDGIIFIIIVDVVVTSAAVAAILRLLEALDLSAGSLQERFHLSSVFRGRRGIVVALKRNNPCHDNRLARNGSFPANHETLMRRQKGNIFISVSTTVEVVLPGRKSRSGPHQHPG